MKKILFLLTLAGSALFADRAMQTPQPSSRDYNSQGTQMEQPTITPTCRCASNGYGVSFYGGPVYMRLVEEGLEYAVKSPWTYSSEPIDNVSSFGRINMKGADPRMPDFSWDWGFKVGLKYDMPYDGWDLDGSWLRFHSSASDHVSAAGNPDPDSIDTDPLPNAFSGSGELISSFWVAKLFSAPGLMNQAKARWNADIDFIGLELGRNFHISEFLCLRPFVGLSNGWIDQTYNIFFSALNFDTPPPEDKRVINIKMKNDFWGIGPEFGLQSFWKLGKGFSIYANGAFSLLDGHFKVSYDLHDQNNIVDIVPTGSGLFNPVTGAFIPTVNKNDPYDDRYEMSKKIHTLAMIANFELGIKWERSFAEDKYCLALSVGYEQYLFFNQNRFMNPQYDFTLISISPAFGGSSEGPNYFTDRGNMTLSGVTGKVAFTF